MTGDDLRAFCERNPGIDEVCRHKLLEAADALDALRDELVRRRDGTWYMCSDCGSRDMTTLVVCPHCQSWSRTELREPTIAAAEAATGGGETE